LWAITPSSGTHTYSAFEPPLIPKTSSPGAKPLTAAPTCSTTPANSIPATGRFGRVNPVKTRANQYSLLRTPQSLRVTLDERTRTSTSFSFGSGRGTSSIRSTSGGP
jgi:hypothetical protein